MSSARPSYASLQLYTTFSAAQIRSVNLIVEHLTADGFMEVARLYEYPFTERRGHDLH